MIKISGLVSIKDYLHLKKKSKEECVHTQVLFQDCAQKKMFKVQTHGILLGNGVPNIQSFFGKRNILFYF